MTDFYFGNNCTFCQSRIGSTHCLLPYQLVVTYHAPTDITSKVIDITEIHMRYGIEALNDNFRSFEWIRERSNSLPSVACSNVASSEPRQWSEQMSEISKSHSPTNAGVPIENTPVQSGLGLPIFAFGQSKNADKGKTLADLIQGKPQQPERIVAIDDSSSAIIKASNEQLRAVKPAEHHTDAQKLELKDMRKFELTRDTRNHIINDAVIVAKVAQNLYSASRGWIKVSALKESIVYESDIRNRLGAKYLPSSNMKLDGNIALAKMIVATHDVQSIQAWESGQTATHGPYCLLGRKFLSMMDDKHHDLPLFEELIKCFSNTIDILNDNEKDGGNITESIKFTLIKDDYPSTYDWTRNRMKYIEMTKISKSPTLSLGDNKKKAKKIELPYPPIDEKLLDFINIKLQVCVNKHIEIAGKEIPRMPDETKLTTFFFKLASEFLRRNKGWHNENSFTSPQHLTKLEELTGLKTQSSETFLTFSILRDIISEFRVAFKQRYPKIERPKSPI